MPVQKSLETYWMHHIINTYLKEQIEYIQGQINKIRNSGESISRQSQIAKQIVNKVSKKKSILRAKLKAASQYRCGKNISRIWLETLLKS